MKEKPTAQVRIYPLSRMKLKLLAIKKDVIVAEVVKELLKRK